MVSGEAYDGLQIGPAKGGAEDHTHMNPMTAMTLMMAKTNSASP